MTQDAAQELDRRTRRTRTAITQAFLRLIFAGRYDKIRTADLIAEAGVGRSTFYEHFRNKDEVLVSVIDPLFVPLAMAAVGRVNMVQLGVMLDHLWEQRALGRLLFEPFLLAKLQRKLAAMIEARLDGEPSVPATLVATGVAAGQLAILRMWIVGEVACPAGDLARYLATGPLSGPGGPASAVSAAFPS